MSARAALVTGASSGIGFGIAQLLVERGYRVSLVARDRAKLEAAVRHLSGATQAIPADVSHEESIREAVGRHRDRFGRLDVLVNSAGVGAGRPLDKISARQLDMQYQVNLRGIVLFYREALALLKQAAVEHRNANVLNIASISGKVGVANFSAYSATKFAVVGFSQSMNRELGPLGIKSTAICPHLVETPMTEFIRESDPGRPMLQVADVVAVCRMLLELSPGCLAPEVILTSPDGSLEMA